jgi:hypothetical protein
MTIHQSLIINHPSGWDDDAKYFQQLGVIFKRHLGNLGKLPQPGAQLG